MLLTEIELGHGNGGVVNKVCSFRKKTVVFTILLVFSVFTRKLE